MREEATWKVGGTEIGFKGETDYRCNGGHGAVRNKDKHMATHHRNGFHKAIGLEKEKG